MSYQEIDIDEFHRIRLVTQDGDPVKIVAERSHDYDEVKVAITAHRRVQVVREEIEHRYPQRKK